jgi:ATP synthase protein I
LDNKKVPLKEDLSALNAASLGLTMVITTAIGLGLGVYLDKKFSTNPWFTIFFFVIGVVSGFWQLIKDVKGYNGKNKRKNT